jgi:DNA-binding NarL/FixJ family response regulator
VESPATQPIIRILLVDDHCIVRDALTALIERQGKMKVVGAAATGQEAILSAMALVPDVVVMDLMMPGLNGIDATQRILELLPHTRVVVLSGCHSSEHVYRALRVGARGYLMKDVAGAELLLAIATVFKGERYLSSEVTSHIVDDLTIFSASHSPLERLSKREREVLHLTVAGSTSAEIGQQLSLSRRTVDTYRSRLMQKLGVPNLASLIHFAVEHALTPS